MSILVPAVTGDGLKATSNLSNPQSCTKMIWAKMAGSPASFETLLSSHNAAYTVFANLDAGSGSGQLEVGTSPGVLAHFLTQPTWTNWNCYFLTMTAAGANSLTGFWQDNAGGGFASQSITGVTFTSTNDDICMNNVVQAMTLAYYMEWSGVLSGLDMNKQFLAPTPIVQLGNLRRYLALTTAASAGNDTSGNGFNMIPTGLSDGAGTPAFPQVPFAPYSLGAMNQVAAQ